MMVTRLVAHKCEIVLRRVELVACVMAADLMQGNLRWLPLPLKEMCKGCSTHSRGAWGCTCADGC